MVVFRCTERVVTRFHLRRSDDAPASDGLLGDWYANLLNVDHARLVLCVSARALLPVLVPARQSEFPGRFSEHLTHVLEQLGVRRDLIEREARLAQTVLFARTRSRQVLGVMNDFGAMAAILLQDDYPFQGLSLLDASLKLAEAPSKPIQHDSPGRVTQALFAAAGQA